MVFFMILFYLLLRFLFTLNDGEKGCWSSLILAQEIGEFCAVQECRATDFEASEFVKGSVGKLSHIWYSRWMWNWGSWSDRWLRADSGKRGWNRWKVDFEWLSRSVLLIQNEQALSSTRRRDEEKWESHFVNCETWLSRVKVRKLQANLWHRFKGSAKKYH